MGQLAQQVGNDGWQDVDPIKKPLSAQVDDGWEDVPTEPRESLTEGMSRRLTGSQHPLTDALSMAGNAIMHPIDTVTNFVPDVAETAGNLLHHVAGPQLEALRNVVPAAKSGHLLDAVGSGVEGVLPIAGPAIAGIAKGVGEGTVTGDYSEPMRDVAALGVQGLTAKLAPKLPGAIKKAVPSPFTRSANVIPTGAEFTPAEVEATAASKGVQRPAAQVTGSPALHKLQDAGRRSIVAGGGIEKQLAGSKQGVLNWIEETKKGYTNVTPEEGGAQIQAAIRKAMRTAQTDVAKKLVAAKGKFIKGTPQADLKANFSNPKSPLYKIVNERSPISVYDHILGRGQVMGDPRMVRLLNQYGIDTGPIKAELLERSARRGLPVESTGGNPSYGGYSNEYLKELFKDPDDLNNFKKLHVAGRSVEFNSDVYKPPSKSFSTGGITGGLGRAIAGKVSSSKSFNDWAAGRPSLKSAVGGKGGLLSMVDDSVQLRRDKEKK